MQICPEQQARELGDDFVEVGQVLRQYRERHEPVKGKIVFENIHTLFYMLGLIFEQYH